MIKQAPSLGRMVAMIVFALSCFGILIFLWIAFGGSIPLRPESYRVTIPFKEATTLAVEADVREAGVNVGKVKAKKLDKRGASTDVTVELKPEFAPIAKDARAILRQKTLLGETYVELSPGHKSKGTVDDGGQLPASHVEPTVQLDEIFSAFTPSTRQAFRDWVRELRKASQGKASESLNDAFGNLAGFSTDGAKLFRTLDEQGQAVHRLIRNTGEVFGAINERQGALRQLIVNSNNVFEATASRDRALAATFHIFPTFLDESKATQARLEDFSRNTHPLVNALKGPADDLGPTFRDLGQLSPDLEGLFRDLGPVIRTSRTTVPKLRKVIGGTEPVLESFGPFLDQLNPILSYFNFHQATIAGFLTNGAADIGPDFQGQTKQVNIGMIEPRSFQPPVGRIPDYARGNAYLAPNALQRAQPLGTFESFLCPNGGQERRDPLDNPPPQGEKEAPCFNAPASLFNGKKFVLLEKGKVPRVDAPGQFDGTKGTNPNTR